MGYWDQDGTGKMFAKCHILNKLQGVYMYLALKKRIKAEMVSKLKKIWVQKKFVSKKRWLKKFGEK